MSDAKVGLYSALGAVLGGAAGAAAGYAAAKYRPRVRFSMNSRGSQIEDAMVIGGATGAVVGAFIGGTVGSNDPPLLTQNPQR